MMNIDELDIRQDERKRLFAMILARAQRHRELGDLVRYIELRALVRSLRQLASR